MAVRTTRAEHPLAAVVTHWLHVVALVVLVWTGFFMHSPFYNASFALHRNIHVVAAFVLIFTGISRIYWAFFGAGSADVGSTEKICDCRFFLPDKMNRGKLWQMIKYYMFLRKSHPRTAKYNPLQKLAYLALLVAMLVVLVTGLEMWAPTKEFWQPLAYFLGGPLVVRLIHYFSMWLFIVVTATHIYLTFAETPWEVPLMFWWKEARFVGRDGETVPTRKGKEGGGLIDSAVMILGLGNDLMGDDGVGLAILERLAQSDFPALFPTVRLEWGGTAGMGLLRHFRESDVVIVVDGIETGSEPGSIFRFSAEDILGKNLRSESLHGVGIPQLVAHARLTGARPQVIVCSVQVGEVLPRFNSLTPAVAAAVEPVCGLVREEVRRILTPDRLPSTARRGAAALSA